MRDFAWYTFWLGWLGLLAGIFRWPGWTTTVGWMALTGVFVLAAK